MALTVLSLSRRHVLGDLYNRCDAMSESIPVYLAGDEAPVLLGHADESLGHYADAMSFHLEPDDCKKLSSGNFSFSITYELSEKPSAPGSRSRVKLTSITLTGRKSYEKPPAKTVLATE
jgi:hypothetical protein